MSLITHDCLCLLVTERWLKFVTDFRLLFLSESLMANRFIASVCITLFVQPVVSEDTKTNAAIMWMIRKPLQCHTIDTYIIGEGIRSVMDCALKCAGDLYSCVGYVLSATNNGTTRCEVCWIYDVIDEVIQTANDSNVTVYMPTESRQKGGYNGLQQEALNTVYHMMCMVLLCVFVISIVICGLYLMLYLAAFPMDVLLAPGKYPNTNGLPKSVIVR